jgi:hypothetical protein
LIGDTLAGAIAGVAMVLSGHPFEYINIIIVYFSTIKVRM